MLPYYMLTILPFIVFGIYKGDKKEQRVFTLGAFFFMLFLLLCFRHISVGTDIEAYKDTFEKVGEAKWSKIFSVSKMEKGYILINKVVSVFSKNFQFFLCIVALFTLFPFYYLYKNETENPLLCIALFLSVVPFSMFFSGIRQIIAMSFIVPAYYYTKKKQVLPFLAMILLAFLFHKSALIMLLLYPIYHIKISKLGISIIALLLLIVFVFREKIFLGVLELLGGTYEERYGKVEDTGAFATAILFIIFIVYSYVIPDEGQETKEVRGLRNLLFLMIGIQIFASINPIIMRMNYYFIMFIPVLIPKIAETPSQKNKNLAVLSKIVMVAFFIGWFFYLGYRGEDILNIFPYKFFWE